MLALGGVFLAAKAWPKLEAPLWAAFLGAVGYHIYREQRKPVNYDSITVCGRTIEYVSRGGRELIDLAEVMRLSFVREEALFEDLYGPYLETKWLIQMREQHFVEVMDEWPHRRLLLRTFAGHLPGFDAASARKGIRSREKGQWVCFERSTSVV